MRKQMERSFKGSFIYSVQVLMGWGWSSAVQQWPAGVRPSIADRQKQVFEESELMVIHGNRVILNETFLKAEKEQQTTKLSLLKK